MSRKRVPLTHTCHEQHAPVLKVTSSLRSGASCDPHASALATTANDASPAASGTVSRLRVRSRRRSPGITRGAGYPPDSCVLGGYSLRVGNVLVVGGAGYIGGWLTDQIRDAGHDVRVFDVLL